MGACLSSPSATVSTTTKSPSAAAAAAEHSKKKHNMVGNSNGVVMATTTTTKNVSTSPTTGETTALSSSSLKTPPPKQKASDEGTTANKNKSSQQHYRSPSQDVSIGSNFSSCCNSNNSDDDDDSSQSSFNNNKQNRSANNNGSNGSHASSREHPTKNPCTPTRDLTPNGANNSNNHKADLSTSHRRRKSRQLDHSDSRVGLHEIISGDLKNPNLVRIEVPLGKPIEEVYEGVHDGPVLGSGISGIVRLVKHKKTGVQYAVKCLDLALIDSEEGLKQLKEEIYIMCQLDHPNIVRLEEVYESHSEIYLVQEICKGGELFDRLDEQPDYHYTEAQCAKLVKQMLSSVRYIHNKGIIHRDLKLENFLFSDLDEKSELKMIDFGLSKHFQFGEVHHEAVGTPYTVAPEVIRGSYDERCDVWAVGVITYLLLSGEPPFGGCGGPETLMEVRDNILRGEFAFEPEDIWETVSKEAKEFIKTLLVLDPMKRPTAQQCSNLKWLKMWKNRENNGTELRLNPAVVKALVGFKEYSDMRKLLCEVLSFTLLPEQIEGLRKEFELYDVEGTGEISLSTLKKVLIGNASTGSLGGLSEEEVEDIFNALRVRKGEATIHWHDFIAAGLSQCQVDERNLRLAFERLDQEHKGYITFDNVMDLLGDEAFDTEDDMLNCWAESMKDVDCKTALITYEDFVLLMKGQNRDRTSMRKSITMEPLETQELLFPVPEIECEMDEESNDFVIHSLDQSNSFDQGSIERTGSNELENALLVGSPKKSSFLRQGSNSAPATPIHMGRRFDDIDQNSPPLLSSDAPVGVRFAPENVFRMPDLDLTPPQSPVRGPADYVTPTVGRPYIDPKLLSKLAPPQLSLPANFIDATPAALARSRSISMDEKEIPTTKKLADLRKTMLFKRDSRRAMPIPEHTHNKSDIDRVIQDETQTPLVVNRKLYRAHREFRHAVTEACKRFEAEQIRRAKETLQARENGSAKHTAGLVMRHGQALSEQSIKNFLKKTMEEQAKQVDQANRRGGRGKRSRKKTMSDMSGMFASPVPDEVDAGLTSSFTGGDAMNEQPLAENPKNLAPVKENENLLRNPTKPGEFRKTNYDPFQRRTLENFSRKSSGSAGEAGHVAPPSASLPKVSTSTQ
ncbi:hypothetical protein ACHAXM_003735 [Skeletonema potamos]